MPFTPFHFGPGLALKAMLPRHFSFTVFAFTNIAIDLEPLYFMVTGQPSLHRFFHTYLGATIIALSSIFIGCLVGSWTLWVWNGYLNAIHINRLHFAPQIAYRPAIIAAFLGAYSHVLFDSLMHSDMHPFAPFTNINPLLSTVSLIQLHLFCLMSGLIGLLISVIKRN